RGAAGRLERRLEHQVLRRIAGDEQLGKGHELGTELCGFIAGAADLGGVAGDVADRRIELRKRDFQAVSRAGIHANDLARGTRPGNRRRTAPRGFSSVMPNGRRADFYFLASTFSFSCVSSPFTFSMADLSAAISDWAAARARLEAASLACVSRASF